MNDMPGNPPAEFPLGGGGPGGGGDVGGICALESERLFREIDVHVYVLDSESIPAFALRAHNYFRPWGVVTPAPLQEFGWI